MLTSVFTKTTRDRWKGMAIGVSITLAALLFFGMSVYRDIDLSVYTSLPEVFRTLMDIPSGRRRGQSRLRGDLRLLRHVDDGGAGYFDGIRIDRR